MRVYQNIHGDKDAKAAKTAVNREELVFDNNPPARSTNLMSRGTTREFRESVQIFKHHTFSFKALLHLLFSPFPLLKKVEVSQ